MTTTRRTSGWKAAGTSVLVAVALVDQVAAQRPMETATDTVGYMGMPPTGKAIRTPGIQIFRFSNGKIVESWAARDDLGTLRQLGHLAVPGGFGKH